MLRRLFPAALIAAALASYADTASAQDCSSFDPADWPQPAKPYFMLVVDTSGSMTACTTPPTNYPTECNQNAAGYQLNSCGMVPTRFNDAKCALRKTVLAYAGQVNFGLSTYASFMTNCNPGACQSACGTPNGGSCSFDYYSPSGCQWNTFPSSGGSACGNNPACSGPGPAPPNFPENSWLNGGNIVVDMLQDPFWSATQPSSNVNLLLEWFDGQCDNSRELFAAGSTPISGALQSAAQYMRAGWSQWSSTTYCPNPTFARPTFMDAQDRECRNVNVLLLTDGDDTCNGQNAAVNAASDLFNNGVTLGGKNWPVRVHVINFAGGTQANTNAIAAAGGTGASLSANNEQTLALAMSNIIAGAISPEVCNNGDDNCNGCIDEGYKKYCNIGQTCADCMGNFAGLGYADEQSCRDGQIAIYEMSLSTNPPDGDLEELPCTSSQQQMNSATWLCYDPGDVCDDFDNNCQDGNDEFSFKCGNPPHCPSQEQCDDGIDNDCDGQVDEDDGMGGSCSGCVPSTEICDGCDNDCDGVADNPPPGGFSEPQCGLLNPPNCLGTRVCEPPVAVPVGTCNPAGGYGACNNNPQPEVCDGVDNNCNGQTDEGYVPVGCESPTAPPGLDYGPNSQCQLGMTQCVNGSVTCVGWVGPSAEVCDGVDNDCDGVVDDNVANAGQQCGVNTPPCSPGTTACVNGVLICQGGNQPQPEVCDGADNDCDGNIDEAPLADAPAPGMNGCWNEPGNCCSHQNLEWCPPTDANCHDLGTLVSPCSTGTLACQQGAWVCINPNGPDPEVCDGLDNDCDGVPDDGNLPNVGDQCGETTPPCMPGTIICNNGALDCDGEVEGTPEVCDGDDNDCDGFIDEGIPPGGPCTPAYDTNLYPGDRDNPPCMPGVMICDGNGNMICSGGVGPMPEVCDGQDNDCDGNIDEAGAAPDGIDGSANPFPPPDGVIGEACGANEGLCADGAYACVNGSFACLGATGPKPESCDCEDNDCDGTSDELPGPGEQALCSEGSDCVQAPDHCQCAQPCSTGEFPCPPGQICMQVQISGGGTGEYCVTDFEALCGDCSTKTAVDGGGETLCAPDGTDPPNCNNTPVCECKGQAGCREPCFNVECGTGEVCSNFGPNPGTCVQANNCYQTGCSGCDKACQNGDCVDNPCTPDSCPPDQVAKPSADFGTCNCVGSCAGVDCPSGEICQDGACVQWCNPPCSGGQVCDPDTLECVDNMCTDESCPGGEYCDPVTGICGNDPCSGVLCPEGQVCDMGQCHEGGGTGGAGGGGGQGGAATTGQGGNNQPGASGSTDPQAEVPGVYGQPSGGGGCACDAAGSKRDDSLAWLGLVGLMLAIGRRRRSAREEGGR